MTYRDRNRNTYGDGGTASIAGSVQPGYSYTNFERCVDNVPGPGALDVIKTLATPESINGSRTDRFGTYTFNNYVTGPMASHLSVTLPSFSTNSDATKAAARSNPSRPEVDLPVFFAELKDVPRMIKFFGDQAKWLSNPRKWGRPSLPGIGERLAHWNLQYQFGLAPMIGDVATMLGFAAEMNSRKREIDSLHKNGGLRRRISLGNDMNSKSESLVISSVGGGSFLVQGNRTSVASRKRWAVVRWRPTGSPPSAADRDLMAARAVLGLNLSASQIWELIPWSWLIDYASSMGDYLAANRNFVPARLESVWCMQTFEQRTVVTRTSGPSWLSGGSSSISSVTKSRQLGVVTPFDVSLPFISARRASILSSLAVLRARRL